MKKSSTKFIDEFSEEVFNHTYRFGDETINDTQLRVAKELAKVEKDQDYWTSKFLNILEDFKFVPGGRITSNAGTGLKGTTYINCFVDGFIGEDQDSMESISNALARQALILKSEGGYGFCSDVLRPKGSFIHGIGNETPGAVRMLDMWDTQSFVITKGSDQKSTKKGAKQKIRKGAQMVTLSCFSDSTEVLTNLGWLNILEVLYLKDKNKKVYAADEDGKFHEIYNPIVREPEPIFEVETESGEKIRVTGDHEFEVKNVKTGEVYLKALKDIDINNEYAKIITVI
jgi:ribonucleotide reductase alpha subunit